MKRIKQFFCWIGWHSIGYECVHKKADDPLQFLTFARCRWCGFEGQVDSQGNLF